MGIQDNERNEEQQQAPQRDTETGVVAPKLQKEELPVRDSQRGIIEPEGELEESPVTPSDRVVAAPKPENETPEPETANTESPAIDGERKVPAVQTPAATVPETVNESKEEEVTPPYPYQQQPLEGKESADHARYPQLAEEQQQNKAEEHKKEVRWGSPAEMGPPSHPSAHPDNQQVAAGHVTPQEPAGVTGLHDPKGNLTPQAPEGANGNLDSYDRNPENHETNDPNIANIGRSSSGAGNSADSFQDQVTDLSKKVELAVSHLWGHLSAGPSVIETAWGMVNTRSKILTHGGFENMFKQAFPSPGDELLKKTYSCFLATSKGPVAGTLFISSQRLAFCSDRPLVYTPVPGENYCYSYYKVVIPIDRIKDVIPSVNHEKKHAEKYIELVTQDSYEFWFMGFVNYDKGVKNLEAALPNAGRGNHTNAGTNGAPAAEGQTNGVSQ